MNHPGKSDEASTAAYNVSAWKMPVHQHASIESAMLDGISKDGIHRIVIAGGKTLDLCAQGMSLLAAREHDKVLLVGLSGAATNRSGKKAPFFAGLGIARGLELPLVAVADPTLALDSDLPLAWYAGSEAVPDLPRHLARVLEGLAGRHQARLIIFGGSGGGYAGLLMATVLECRATVMVWNPQTAIADYVPRFVAQYIEAAFPGRGDVVSRMSAQAAGKQGEYLREVLDTAAITHDVRGSKLRPGIDLLYLQNQSDWHVARHAVPYLAKGSWRRMGQAAFVEQQDKQIGVFFGQWGEGHAAPPKAILEAVLRKLADGEPVVDVVQALDAGLPGLCDSPAHFPWPAAHSCFRLEASARVENDQVHATCSVELEPIETEGVTYAFYLLVDGVRQAKRWYEPRSDAHFDLPNATGKLEVVAFARDRLQNQVSVRIPVGQDALATALIPTLNVELAPFKSLRNSIDLIKKLTHRILSSQAEIDAIRKFSKDVNISPYALCSTSSVSEWDKQRTGHPLDGASTSDRFSFHTALEEDPFIIIDLQHEFAVTGIKVYLRSQFTEKSLPLRILISANRESWFEIKRVNEVSLLIEIPIDASELAPFRYLKIERIGYGYLYLSSVNIFCKRAYFLQKMQDVYQNNPSQFILVHAPFYGLGGRLAVLATAFGYLQKSVIKNIVVHWGYEKEKKQLAYPLAVDYFDNHKSAITKNMSKYLLSYIYDQKVKVKSEKRVSDWKPPDVDGQNRDVTFISRDNINSFINRHESLHSCQRRLYQNIIPSSEIEEYSEKIEIDFDLKRYYGRALAIHVRHGNGERYYNSVSKHWGVKPPSKIAIIDAVKSALAKGDGTIDTIVLSSDCRAVFDLLRDLFETTCKVIFISKYIQGIGAGCNHTPHRFDASVARMSVDMVFDDTVTFAEILVLSKCIALCGGKSFFFDAVIGFSTCDAQSISRLENGDRYALIGDSFKSLCDFEQDEFGWEILHVLRNSRIKIDGLFLDMLSNSSQLTLNYFDNEIFKGTAMEFNSVVTEGSLLSSLENLRLY